MTVGETLKALRTGAGLRLKDLAERTDYSVTHLSDLENQKQSPTIRTLQKVCADLGVSLSEFFWCMEERE